jgi:hypothetical protein
MEHIMADDARKAEGGQQRGEGNDQDGLDRALQRRNEDLAGDIEENRNLSGSTTYETLSEEGDLDVASGRDEQNRGDQNRGGQNRGGSSSGGQR